MPLSREQLIIQAACANLPRGNPFALYNRKLREETRKYGHIRAFQTRANEVLDTDFDDLDICGSLTEAPE